MSQTETVSVVLARLVKCRQPGCMVLVDNEDLDTALQHIKDLDELVGNIRDVLIEVGFTDPESEAVPSNPNNYTAEELMPNESPETPAERTERIKAHIATRAAEIRSGVTTTERPTPTDIAALWSESIIQAQATSDVDVQVFARKLLDAQASALVAMTKERDVAEKDCHRLVGEKAQRASALSAFRAWLEQQRVSNSRFKDSYKEGVHDAFDAALAQLDQQMGAYQTPTNPT